MFKFVVLLSVAAMAAANGVVAPLAYGGVPAVRSVSQYSTTIAHPSVYPVPAVYSGPAVYSAPAVVGYHNLHKRSVVAPVAYSRPLVTAYSTPLVTPYAAAPVVPAYSAPVVASPLAYSGVYPRALSVHPY